MRTEPALHSARWLTIVTRLLSGLLVASVAAQWGDPDRAAVLAAVAALPWCVGGQLSWWTLPLTRVAQRLAMVAGAVLAFSIGHPSLWDVLLIGACVAATWPKRTSPPVAAVALLAAAVLLGFAGGASTSLAAAVLGALAGVPLWMATEQTIQRLTGDAASPERPVS